MARKYKLTTSDTYKNYNAGRSEREWKAEKRASTGAVPALRSTRTGASLGRMTVGGEGAARLQKKIENMALDKGGAVPALRSTRTGASLGRMIVDKEASSRLQKKIENMALDKGGIAGASKGPVPGARYEKGTTVTPPAKGNGWGTRGKTDAFSNKSEWQKESEARKSSQQGWQGTKTKMSPGAAAGGGGGKGQKRQPKGSPNGGQFAPK